MGLTSCGRISPAFPGRQRQSARRAGEAQMGFEQEEAAHRDIDE
jgi:hypothetical protein